MTDRVVEAGRRVMPNEPAYGEVLSWLYDEADLLDTGRFDDWLALLASDLVYRVPVRAITAKDQGDGVSAGSYHFDETRSSIETRVLRLHQPTAWAENPASRTRHMVSNVRVWTVSSGFVACSSLLLLRTRGAATSYELLSGERHDLLRSVDGCLLLSSREVELDQSALGMSNLSVFL